MGGWLWGKSQVRAWAWAGLEVGFKFRIRIGDKTENHDIHTTTFHTPIT